MRVEPAPGTLSSMTTAATDHTTTITDLYAAFGRGDIPAILGALADDVRWEHWDDNTAQREGVSHLQPRMGPDGVAEFFAVAREIVFHTFEIRGIAAGDDLVVADILIDATLPSGGRMRDEELHMWRFDAGGRVCSMRHYVDTAKHIAAERGEDTITRPQRQATGRRAARARHAGQAPGAQDGPQRDDLLALGLRADGGERVGDG
jgi:ketosteroid isomerase-like protein